MAPEREGTVLFYSILYCTLLCYRYGCILCMCRMHCVALVYLDFLSILQDYVFKADVCNIALLYGELFLHGTYLILSYLILSYLFFSFLCSRAPMDTPSNQLAPLREETEEEKEAKKRRRLQVLQMLSGAEEGMMVLPETSSSTAATAATAAVGASMPMPPPPPTFVRPPVSASTSASASAVSASAASAPTPVTAGPVKLLGLRGKSSNVPNKQTFAQNDEEEVAPKREIVRLEYTAEELAEMARQSAHPHTHGDEDDDDLDGQYRKKAVLPPGAIAATTTAAAAAAAVGAPNLSSIHAKVLAQAQAISAQLAQKNSTAPVPAAPAAPALSAEEVEKAKLKALVDKIPTTRYVHRLPFE
jgi:hypothetical protein